MYSIFNIILNIILKFNIIIKYNNYIEYNIVFCFYIYIIYYIINYDFNNIINVYLLAHIKVEIY